MKWLSSLLGRTEPEPVITQVIETVTLGIFEDRGHFRLCNPNDTRMGRRVKVVTIGKRLEDLYWVNLGEYNAMQRVLSTLPTILRPRRRKAVSDNGRAE